MQTELDSGAPKTPVSPVTEPGASRLWRWFELLSPWASLIISVVSAFYMDRSESSGGLIVLGAALSFVALVAVAVAHRERADSVLADSERAHGKLHKLIRFATASGGQSLLQTSLLFSAPFYVQASAFTVWQCLFLGVMAVATAVSLWDPWCLRCMLHPLLGPALLSFASFAAWNAALPMLGVSHERALWLSAVVVSVLVPLLMLLHHQSARWRLGALVGGALLPLALAGLGVRALPAAPLKVVDAGIGTDVQERALVGRADELSGSLPRLWCFSAVFAPRGMSDQLEHVWSREDEPLARISLSVRGGRKAGFRTWSKLPLPHGARGRYRCEVRTPLGQTLSVNEVTVR